MLKNSLKRFFLDKHILIRFAAIMLPLIVLVFTLIQPALARTTYIINDGDRITVHSSVISDPTSILDHAGYTLEKTDRVVTQETDGVSEITIYRTQNIEIYNCGELVTAISHGETVQELLSRLDIQITPDTTVSVDLDESTYDGMVIDVNKDISQIETYSSVIPYVTIHVNDATLPIGEEKLVTEGCNGEEVFTAMVHYHNGHEIDRDVQSSIITVEPINKIIAVGVMEYQPEPQPPVVEAYDSTGGCIELPTGEVLTYTAKLEVMGTAYTCEGGWSDGITATGTEARVGEIAVDPSVIPLGTRVFIRSTDGEYIYGIATAEDTGNLIIGYRIDLYMDTEAECFEFGYRPCEVYILG